MGLRQQTASSRAKTGGSVPRSMLSTRGSVRWALSGVQGQGCRRAWGPAWARAGTQGEQAAGATASPLQPSEVAAEGSGEVVTGAQGRAGGRWPVVSGEGVLGSCGQQWRQQSWPGVAAGGSGMTGSGGELPAHPAWPRGGRKCASLEKGPGQAACQAGRGSATGFVAGWGALWGVGRQWGGRAQAPGWSPHIPHPLQGWLMGRIW